jgi:large subunit ribosomal protein L19
MALQTKHKETTFHVGDTVAVHQKVVEKDKERTQIFEGTVISIKGKDGNKMFTVRKISYDAVGVERIWPLFSPWIKKIIVKKQGSTRRAKLYYLRGRTGKEALKVKRKEVKKPADEKPKPWKIRRKSSRKTSSKKQLQDS